MNSYDRAVDHLHLTIVSLRHRIHQAIPDAGLSPTIEAIVGRRVWAIPLGQIPPRCTGSQHAEDAVHHPTIILPLWARTTSRQPRFYDCPLRLRQIIAHVSSSPLLELESRLLTMRYK
jgi:hypothetical protein